MNFKNFGSFLSILIWLSPGGFLGPDPLLSLPLNFFKKANAPEAGLDISRRPILVKEETSGADIIQTMASQDSLLSFKFRRIGLK